MPAVTEPHDWCGLWMQLGRINAHEHKKLGKGNRIYLKQFQRSCYRATCKRCYLKWIARQANSATRRIEKYATMTSKKPIHLILVVPPSQHHLPVKLLRQRMSHILKIAELDGAAVAFHPFRFNHDTRQWYSWPHFHLVGFGSEQKIRKSFGRYGWFVKNEIERFSLSKAIICPTGIVTCSSRNSFDSIIMNPPFLSINQSTSVPPVISMFFKIK